MPILDREEYIEQAYLYRMLSERMQREMATQELLTGMKQELLASTKLPHAARLSCSGSEIAWANGTGDGGWAIIFLRFKRTSWRKRKMIVGSLI